MTMLKNLVVLSLEQAISLPYCTFRLGLEGAEVIKVESLDGDPNRYAGQPTDERGMNSYFISVNGGKKSITINLAQEKGQSILYEMIRQLPVDVFCTNQLPGNYEKLGISYERLSSVKPDLIWVGLSGFGPARSEPAYDPIIQAYTGLMDETGEADRPPMMAGAAVADLLAGNEAFTRIMQALYKREITGEGSRIDISMAQCTLAILNTKFANVEFNGRQGRHGNRDPHFAPANTYEAKDGTIIMAIGNQRQWMALVAMDDFKLLDRVEYSTFEGRLQNVDKMEIELSEIISGQTVDQIKEICKAARIPVMKVNKLSEALEDPFLSAMLFKTQDSRTGIAMRLAPPPSDVPGRNNCIVPFAPRLGEHNDLLLNERLGYTLEMVEGLRLNKIII